MASHPYRHAGTETLRLQAEEAVKALPALFAKAERVVAGILHGEHTQRRSGPGEKFWQFRDYSPGDRPQDIDWRQSAKGSRVFIRQREWQNAQAYLFWCSAAPGMDYASSKYLSPKRDAAQILSLALALLFSHGGEMIAPFGAPRAGRGEAGLQKLGQNLILPDSRDPLPDGVSAPIPNHAALILAGDFLEPPEDIAACFDMLSARTENALVLQILDPAELELPFEGNVIFEGIEGGRRVPVRHVGSVRAAYRGKMTAHLNELEALCRRRGWPYVLHRTDRDMTKTVEKIWMMVNRTHI